jgi:predicted DsbA family dithiol-disulfide isomerase
VGIPREETTVLVDIWADLVCPWCYIGKSRFDQALADFAHSDEVQVRYRSFQLDPSMPKGETVNQLDMLRSKYGLSAAKAQEAEDRVAGLARAEGLPYDRTDGEIGNTFDAHRLVHLAADRGLAAAVLDRFNRAHFAERRSLFDHESLVALAAEAGLDPDEARQVLAGDGYGEAVDADAAQAHALGSTGVPFFVVDNRYGVSGAQPTEVFTQVLDRAWEEATASVGRTT